jgi:hypothetical protein
MITIQSFWIKNSDAEARDRQSIATVNLPLPPFPAIKIPFSHYRTLPLHNAFSSDLVGVQSVSVLVGTIQNCLA